MAALTQTVVNTMVVYGMAPTNQWGVMVWGENNWGGAAEFPQTVYKVLSDSQVMTVGYVKDVTHTIGEILTFGDLFAKLSTTTFTDTLVLTGDVTSMVQCDANGYKYIFTKPTTNKDLDVVTAYSAVANSSDIYTAKSNTTSTWTDI